VTAATDDDDIVGPFRLRAAPGWRPVFVMTGGVPQQAENGVAHDDNSSVGNFYIKSIFLIVCQHLYKVP
jgi:hypothetical protein